MFGVSMLMSGAQTIAQVRSQQQQAAAMAKNQAQQQKAHNQYIQQVAIASNEAYQDTTQQELERVSVYQDEAVRDKMQMQREMREAQAEALASSQSSGLSLDMLMRDYERQAANYSDSIMYNLGQQQRYSTWRIKEARAEAQGRPNQIRPFTPEHIQQPDYLTAGLGMVSAGFNAYNEYATPDEQGRRRLR